MNRSCIIATQAFNAADIRLNTDWDETVRIMDMDKDEAVVTEPSYWEKWAKKRVEHTRVMKTTNVRVNESFKRAQEAAVEAVEAMKVAAELEAKAIYEKNLANADDEEIIIDPTAMAAAR